MISNDVKIIVQGPFGNEPDFKIGGVSFEDQCQIIDSWTPYRENIIVSTFEGIENKYLNYMFERGITSIISPCPAFKGLGNNNLQTTSTTIGIAAARELGAKYIFKSRTNLYISSFNTLINSILNNNKKNKISGFVYDSWPSEGLFVIDELMFGPINDIAAYYFPIDKEVHTERFMSERYLEYKKVNNSRSWDNIKNHFYFFMNDTLNLNIEIISMKKYHMSPRGKDYKLYYSNQQTGLNSEWPWFRQNTNKRYLW